MKLEGSLDAFGLPDIFQLLSYTKKTGGLHLRRGAVEGVVYFASGAVTGASSDLGRQTLARRLVGSGAVDDSPLADAVARAQSEGVGVGRALLDAGAVPRDVLQTAAAEQAVDAVDGLLGWPEGDFSFAVDENNPDDVGVELGTERVVADATARREDAQRVAETIPSESAVLTMPVVPPGDRQLSPDEWALMALADGRRSVGEIADLTGSGYVTVAQALAGLLERGLLESGGSGSDHASAVRRRLSLLAPLEDASRAGSTSAPAEPDPEPAPRAQPAAAQAPAAAAARTDVAPRTSSFVPGTPAPANASAAPATSARDEGTPAAQDPQPSSFVTTIGGAHVPDGVVPPRPEPFQPRRQPDHPEVHPAPRPTFEPPRQQVAESPRPVSVGSGVGGVNGSAAMAADPETAAVIERDPSVNRSLLLRLIAGVRGL